MWKCTCLSHTEFIIEHMQICSVWHYGGSKKLKDGEYVIFAFLIVMLNVPQYRNVCYLKKKSELLLSVTINLFYISIQETQYLIKWQSWQCSMLIILMIAGTGELLSLLR